ncbi:MAG TPA: hypothetical protein VFB51_15690 [Solirubrobacterales bacterium]|nr:hypothetical protein [Solirubrobacterales bacterium]
MRPRRVIAAAAVAAASFLAVVALLAAGGGRPYDVRGEADVPYKAGTVKEVRVLDSVTLYVDGEPKPGPSVIGGIGLIALATAAFMTAAALRIAGRRGRLIAFYLLIAAGLGYAGMDELFAIHESIGHNLQFLADLPGVTRPDDLVIAAYLIPAAAFAFVFRDILLSHRGAAAALAGGLGLFALGTGADIAGATSAEKYLELLSGMCIAAGLALLMYSHLRRNLRPDLAPVARDEVTVVDQRAPRDVPAGIAN